MTDRQLKQLEVGLRKMRNTIISAFQMRHISTWAEVYKKQGIDALPNASEPVPDGKVLADYLTAWCNTKVEAAKTPSALTPVTPEVIVTDKPVVIEEPQPTVKFTAENDYGLPFYENLGCSLMHFQKKAVKELLDKFLGFDVSICPDVDALKAEWNNRGRTIGKRGACILSPTGTGKTFMVAGLTKYLHYLEFTRDKTIGPTEYLYVTRSSIVEQTKRVFERQFQLGISDGVEILNIEKLRSRAGELWINPKTVIINGEEKIKWEWRRGLYPICLWLDECQSVKNPTSSQAQIIQSYSEIPTEDTISLFISATPFTRVSEMKAFVLNSHIDDATI